MNGNNRRSPAHQGPIVLITIDALRADVVGAFGGPPKLTPHLDELASQATWAGRAVSPSSWTVPSMASLFTGFQPWSVQTWSGDRAVLRRDLVTLPEALKAKGYRTAGFRSNHWLQKVYGYDQGFDKFQYLGEGRRAEKYLETLGSGREFVWIHILPPHAPYIRRNYLLDHLQGCRRSCRRKVRPLDLEPYFDPAVPLPPKEEKVLRAMYALNAAYADDMLGRMLASLRKSGQWDRTLLVVTSDHGEEFKESGQIAHGGNLGRQLVEVPLMIKLPAGFRRPLALEPGKRAATVRVRATLLEAAGWEPEKGTATSFFQPGSQDTGVLSELYMGNGVNRFSYVEGDRQLLWESRFAGAEPEYYRARYQGIGGKPAAAPVGDRTTSSSAGWRPPSRARSPWLACRVTSRSSPSGAGRTGAVSGWKILGRSRRWRAVSAAAWLAANGKEKPPGKNTGRKPQLTPEQEAEMRAIGYAG